MSRSAFAMRLQRTNIGFSLQFNVIWSKNISMRGVAVLRAR